jgi:predicted ATP-grasp superfamily ATP-dependent carboligase
MVINVISEESDKSTDNILRWLVYYNQPFQRFNVEQYTPFTYLLESGNRNRTKNILHRRAKLRTYLYTGSNALDNYVKEETNMLIKAWEKIIRSDGRSNYMGGFNEEDQHDKLFDLFIAESVGLKIPKTLITNSKKELIDFAEKHKVITKAIRQPIGLDLENISISDQGTLLVDKQSIDELNEHFSLSIFQEYIEKEYEIRALVYGKRIFAMAIFSQMDNSTKTDFRNYNHETPNRCVPFKLPKGIESKILKFFKLKNINMGSIDLIFNENGFYFLENNPQGQYEWLSENCNYYVDRYIAEQLIKFQDE